MFEEMVQNYLENEVRKLGTLGEMEYEEEEQPMSLESSPMPSLEHFSSDESGKHIPPDLKQWGDLQQLGIQLVIIRYRGSITGGRHFNSRSCTFWKIGFPLNRPNSKERILYTYIKNAICKSLIPANYIEWSSGRFLIHSLRGRWLTRYPYGQKPFQKRVVHLLHINFLWWKFCIKCTSIGGTILGFPQYSPDHTILNLAIDTEFGGIVIV